MESEKREEEKREDNRDVQKSNSENADCSVIFTFCILYII